MLDISAGGNYDEFEKNSKIKVNADYSKVRLNSGTDYLELRNEIKSI